MKNLRLSINKTIEHLNHKWQRLSIQQQKSYTLYFFCAYLIISIVVLVNSCNNSKKLDIPAHKHWIINPLNEINPKNFDSLLLPQHQSLKKENHED